MSEKNPKEPTFNNPAVNVLEQCEMVTQYLAMAAQSAKSPDAAFELQQAILRSVEARMWCREAIESERKALEPSILVPKQGIIQ